MVLEAAAYVALLIAGYFLLPIDGRRWFLGIVFGLAVLVAMVPLAVLEAKRILVAEFPFLQAGRAIAIGLTSIVVGFAALYYGLSSHDPGQMHGLSTKVDGIYFSVVTLSTVGYGDITPTGQLARGITTLNIVANLVGVAVAVRVVLWAGRERVSSLKPPPP
jgi:voltage-gated potassium channel Kch